MRILALETSSLRGSVALWEGESALGGDLLHGDSQVVAYGKHEVLNEHAERMLSLVEQTLGTAGWQRSSVDRIAVGVGPGSFTGVRVALALAQGLMLGLGIVGVGVGSLRTLAAGLGQDDRVRLVVRDARREEYFLAAYGRDGTELIAPHAIAQQGAAETVRGALQKAGIEQDQAVVVGTHLEGLPFAETDETKEPDARSVARIAATLDPQDAPVAPQYVRGPNVVRPHLPPSPLDKPRT